MLLAWLREALEQEPAGGWNGDGELEALGGFTLRPELTSAGFGGAAFLTVVFALAQVGPLGCLLWRGQ